MTKIGQQPEGKPQPLNKEELKRRVREHVAAMRKRLASMSDEQFKKWLNK